jgi:4-amino-4-deoxy-L-arabinose transferase-like glycosyltransferase/membrane-associated phospholipid phosphatase
MIWRYNVPGQNFFLAPRRAERSPCAVLQDFDTALFRLVHNLSGHPAFDAFVTFFNGGAWFKRIGILLGILVFWKGNIRIRICLLFLALVVAVGDGVIIGGLKRGIARQRPYLQLADTKPLGRGDAFSMPSGHAANSMAAAIVFATFYRRWRYVAFGCAFMVSFARVYSGVHFPSDVLVGATTALLYSSALLWGVEWLWRNKAPAVVPSLTERIPSLLRPPDSLTAPGPPSSSLAVPTFDWKKLGWILIGVTVLLRLLYLSGGKIELSEDEAYQWLWSKNLALSYYSKPPLIAYTQFLGTTLWGDTAFGVRFFSPILGALGAGALLIFLSRYANPRIAFFTIAAACATPLLAAGSTLMTIDALSVFFWTVAMVLTWRAIERDSTTDWILAGIAVSFGLLAKYVAALEWICVLIFLIAHPPARRQFRRPGLYLAILVSALAFVPIIIWNQQHDWITLTHLNERAGLDRQWSFRYGFIVDFVLAEFGLLNPIFLGLVIWAGLKFWKNRTPLQTFLFCMGAPLFIGYLLYTIRARVQPNWIAPAVLPLFALASTFIEPRWNDLRNIVRPLLKFGFVIGAVIVLFMHDTNLTAKLFSFDMPVKIDPLARVRAWSTLAKIVNEERAKTSTHFIIGAHYGVTSLLTFYTSETRTAPRGNKLIYALATERPVNQFYFWPNYLDRAGEDALFVQREGASLPQELTKQFERIEDLGVHDIIYRGRALHKMHFYAARNLRPQTISSERR